MTNAADARTIILKSLQPVSSENCSLRDAQGRVLAMDLVASTPVPPFDTTGMDGYAVRTEDLAKVGKGARLTLQGMITAGERPSKRLAAQHALRIMTGAPIPENADAVVEQELTSQSNGSIEILEEISAGRNIRNRGEDIAVGDVVIPKGSRLGPAALGVAASIGAMDLEVHRNITVAVLTTGNEIVDPSIEPEVGQIRNSNAMTLEAQLREVGCGVHSLGISKDNIEELCTKIAEGFTTDALVTCGGVSVGEHDFMLKVLEQLHVDIRFWKVNIKPGMPMAFGMWNSSGRSVPIFALPGNPVSTMVTFRVFVRPGLEKMMGIQNPGHHVRLRARLEEDLRKKDSKRHFTRGFCEYKNGQLVVHSTGTQSSGVLTSLIKGNCLIILPEETRDPKKGEEVEIELL